jgi:LSD1 subclass zinc finger protein
MQIGLIPTISKDLVSFRGNNSRLAHTFGWLKLNFNEIFESFMDCKKCSSPLGYIPGENHFRCGYCDSTESFASAVDLPEYSLNDLLDQNPELPLVQAYPCRSCSAVTEISAGLSNRRCPFCGNTLGLNSRTSRHFEPEFVVPFKLSIAKAKECLGEWNSNRSFYVRVGDRLPKISSAEIEQLKLEPVYLPFWIYHQKQPPSLKERRREFSKLIFPTGINVPTKVTHYNGNAFPRQELSSLEPWSLKKLTPFNPAFIRQIPVECASQNLKAAYAQFNNSVAFSDYYIKEYGAGVDIQDMFDGNDSTALRPHGFARWGHVYKTRDLSVAQCLLPVYIGRLIIQGRPYRIFINALRGEIIWDMASLISGAGIEGVGGALTADQLQKKLIPKGGCWLILAAVVCFFLVPVVKSMVPFGISVGILIYMMIHSIVSGWMLRPRHHGGSHSSVVKNTKENTQDFKEQGRFLFQKIIMGSIAFVGVVFGILSSIQTQNMLWLWLSFPIAGAVSYFGWKLADRYLDRLK